MGDTIERQQMSERALDERFEVVDETTDGTDPRWKVWDRAEHCYLPGYWSSARDAPGPSPCSWTRPDRSKASVRASRPFPVLVDAPLRRTALARFAFFSSSSTYGG